MDTASLEKVIVEMFSLPGALEAFQRELKLISEAAPMKFLPVWAIEKALEEQDIDWGDLNTIGMAAGNPEALAEWDEAAIQKFARTLISIAKKANAQDFARVLMNQYKAYIAARDEDPEVQEHAKHRFFAILADAAMDIAKAQGAIAQRRVRPATEDKQQPFLKQLDEAFKREGFVI